MRVQSMRVYQRLQWKILRMAQRYPKRYVQHVGSLRTTIFKLESIENNYK